VPVVDERADLNPEDTLDAVVPESVRPARASQFNSSSTGSPYGQMAGRNESQVVRGARAADALAVDASGRSGLPRLETGIPGFDHIAMGGIPLRRTTLVVGSTGCAKTVLCGQFLAEGVRRGQPAVFVTLEESAEDLRRNLGTLGFDVEQAEADGLWEFVDASPVLDPESGIAHYRFDTLLAQIGHAVDRTGAVRLALDSLSAVQVILDEPAGRQQLRNLIVEVRKMGLTSLFTLEAEEGATSFGLSEFVVDNVIVLRNRLEEARRRRTVEVLKMRGAMHRKGEYPFTVLPQQGIVMLPLSTLQLTAPSSDTRVSSGNEGLDVLCSGGLFRDSIVLVSGATGTGKTLMATEFLAGSRDNDERAMMFAFEESRDQIFRNAVGWGRDFARMEAEGRLRIIPVYPEVASLEDHLVEIKREIDEFRPNRVAIDSLSALERSGGGKAFREFAIGLTSYLKSEAVLAMLTAATPSLFGGDSVTEQHVSTLTDTIILLRYVELQGEVRRGLTVLKMRGSLHDHEIREFTIGSTGLEVGDPFRSLGGILRGDVVDVPTP
jgi:circadian clock protein KaiC